MQQIDRMPIYMQWLNAHWHVSLTSQSLKTLLKQSKHAIFVIRPTEVFYLLT